MSVKRLEYYDVRFQTREMFIMTRGELNYSINIPVMPEARGSPVKPHSCGGPPLREGDGDINTLEREQDNNKSRTTPNGQLAEWRESVAFVFFLIARQNHVVLYFL